MKNKERLDEIYAEQMKLMDECFENPRKEYIISDKNRERMLELIAEREQILLAAE